MATTHEITIHASVPVSLAVGGDNPPVINAETYGGTIPYRPNPLDPTQPILLEVGDTLIVRLINDLPYPTGIHWHGIELENYSDGTEVTQNEVPGAPLQTLGNNVPAGGTFLYKFIVPKPGIFWFHPHHHHSTNRVFRGQYGMIVVSEPAVETALRAPLGVLPTTANTHWLGLSDITVCKAPGSNVAATYVDPTTLSLADRAEWLSPNTTFQNGPTPTELCEAPKRLDDMGEEVGPVAMGGTHFQEGEIPNTFRHMAMPGSPPTVEGRTVLTNGENVGGRKGQPGAPGTLDVVYKSIPAEPGQGLRFQIANMASTRYFRLKLTTELGAIIPLIKVGGEGGILNAAVLEGGMLGTYNTKYEAGEILLPPGSRADVVAAIPDTGTAGTTCTMWTRDFQRVGPGNPGGWAQLPSVPVLHIDVGTNVQNPAYSLPPGTPLKAALNLATQQLGSPTDPDPFLIPATIGKIGAPNATVNGATQEIWLTTGPGAGVNGINGEAGSFDMMPYTANPHIPSTRYAKDGSILEFRVANKTNAHHPFHLHGFSFHPMTLETNGGTLLHIWDPTATEFRDNFDIPAGHTVTFRVDISQRPLADGTTPGGAFGRWFFHCHIFFHAHHGMISELVIADPNGREKPNVNVNGSWAYAALGMAATRTGTYSHPDGTAITLSASFGTVNDHNDGTWDWNGTSSNTQPFYVYITAEDTFQLKDQAVFRVKFGPPDDGSDNGDPHIHTVDGKSYDFQAAGEFILLRDREGMEIQTRQTPAPTANPITDWYSGLTSCVSLNTAVAARVGSHCIAYQPGRERGRLQFYLDGKPARLTAEGIDLDGHRVSAFDAGGANALRVDYAHNAVLIVTPLFWDAHNLWYMNVSVSHTQADEGIMGSIPAESWLPGLPSGASVGPMPQSLHERYVALYRTFADAWRVTDRTSLFVYAPGTSTATFTDKDWPAEKPPCRLKPQFQLPGEIAPGIELERAERICRGVTIDALHRDCVFDVATTGDEGFAKGYLLAQDLKLRGSTVQILGDKAYTRPGELLAITAIVTPICHGGPTPTGSVALLVDGVAEGRPAKLDEQGRASLKLKGLAVGEHRIRAVYTCRGGKCSYHPSSSPNLLHSVKRAEKQQRRQSQDQRPLGG